MSPAVTDGSDQAEDIFFGSIVRDFVEENPRFLRRDWLADQVEEKLKDSDRPFVLLTAEPGAGKSAFMAQLAHDHPEWLRYFIRRDQRSVLADVSDKSLLLRIGYQLAALHPELFDQKQVRLSVAMNLGEVGEQAEAVGAEVQRLTASPFYQKVVEIQQQVRANQGRVVGLQVEELVVEPRLLSSEDLLDLALIHPARALQRADPKQQIVILIDALDEIRYQQTSENILAWLASCPDLPGNVRFVLTSRPPDDTLKNFCDKQASRLAWLEIKEDDRHVQSDIERFVAKLVVEPALEKALSQTEGGVEGFRQKAIDKAHGNLGYLDALARGIDQAQERKDPQTLQALLSLKELPADLEGLYAFFLHQIKRGVEGQHIVGKDSSGKTYSVDVWPAVYEPVLGVLAVAAEPLEAELVARLGDIAVDLKWVRPALNRLSQFLDDIDGRYRFYHATVAEMLTADRTKANHETADLYYNAQDWHRQVADYYWQYRENWSECQDGYGFASLAFHLHQGLQFDRLEALMSPEWMETRITRSAGSNEGFIADLELAWRSAWREGEDAERAIVKSIRYALIRTSFNSVSGNYPPLLVARALEDGLWTRERVFGLAARLRGRAAVDLWAAVLATGCLSAQDIRRAEAFEIEAAQGITDPSQRAHALTKLANTLEGEAKTKAVRACLDTTKQIADPGKHADAVAELAQFLNEDEKNRALRQALEQISAIRFSFVPTDDPSWARSRALTQLAPAITEDMAMSALVFANTIVDPHRRGVAMATLASRLPAATRESVVRDLLDDVKRSLEIAGRQQIANARHSGRTHEFSAVESADSDDRAKLLSPQMLRSLAPLLAEDEKVLLFRDFLSLLSLSDPKTSWSALIDLAPVLNREIALLAVDIARQIEDVSARAQLTAALATTLCAEDRQRLLIDAVETLRDADPLDRATGLSAWIQHAEDNVKRMLLRDILAAAQVVASRTFNVLVWADLRSVLETTLTHLSEDDMESALDIVLLRSLAASRDELLEMLAPNLSREQLKRALTKVGDIEDQGARVVAMRALAGQMSGEGKVETVAYALSVALQIEFPYQRVKALEELTDVLDGAEKEKALSVALESVNDAFPSPVLALEILAPHLTGEQIGRGIEVARQLSDGMRPSEALVAEGLAVMSSRLSGDVKQKMIEEVLNSIANSDHDHTWAGVLLRLVPNLDGELARRAWIEVRKLDDNEEKAKVLIEIARRVSEQERGQALSESLAAARRIPRPQDRIATLVNLSEELPESKKKGVLEEARTMALAVVDEYGDKGERAAALSRLVSALDAGTERSLSRTALDLIRETDAWRQAQILKILVPQLDGELLDAAVRLAERITDQKERASALEPVAAKLVQNARDDATQAEVLRQIGDWLWSLKEISRGQILYFCTQALFEHKILSQDALRKLADSIRVIGDEWHFDLV